MADTEQNKPLMPTPPGIEKAVRYFEHDGRPAYQTELSQKPRVFNGAEWQWVNDVWDFYHEASIISKEEFDDMLRMEAERFAERNRRLLDASNL
jgi:hypothetical protein